MHQYVGVLTKIRMVKDTPMMVRFTLETIERSYNCVVVKPEFVTVLLMLQEGKYNIRVEGHFNQRKKLVVESFTVRNPDRFARELGL